MRVLYVTNDTKPPSRFSQAFSACDFTCCRPVEIVSEVSRLVREDGGGVVALDLTRDLTRMEADALHQARSIAPRMGWLGVASLERASLVSVVAFAPSGLDSLILRDNDDSPAQSRHAALQAFRQGIARHCSTRLGAELPSRLHPILKACANCAVNHPSVAAVAALTGLSRNVTRALIREAELCSLRNVLGSCRALAASYFISWSRLPTEDIADAMMFPSANGLRDTLRRYTGLTVRALRQAQRQGQLEQRIITRLRSRTSPAMLTERDATAT